MPPVFMLSEVAPRVAGYAVALGLLGVLLWLPGFVIERLMLARVALGRLRRLAQICLGLGCWTAALFVLAAIGQLRRETIGVAAVLAVVAVVWVWARERRERHARPERAPAWGWRLLIAGGVIALMTPWFDSVFSGEVGWDAEVYHLALPKLYLAAHGFRPIESSVYSNWPQNVELLYALGMSVLDPILATLMHLGFGALTIYAVFVGCREFQSRAPAWLAPLLFFCNAVVAWEFTVAYVDLACSFFLLATVLFLLRAAERENERGAHLLLAGLCGGLLAGAKFNGILNAALLGACYLAWSLPRGSRQFRKEAARVALCYALPVLTLWAPWVIKSAWYTGNPAYPLLYPWFGGPDWSASLASQFAAWQHSIGMGRGVLDYALLLPRVILFGGPGYAHFDGRLNPLWIVLVPLAVALGLRDRVVRRCLGVAGAIFVLWSVTSQQTRFLIPALPLAAMAVAGAFARVAQRIPHVGVRRGVWVVVVALVVLGGLAPVPPRPASADALYAYIRAELPRDARVLCLNTNRGFRIDRDYLADSFFEASQIADWLRGAEDATEVRRRLAEKRITHILVAAQDWGIEYPRGLTELLADQTQLRTLSVDADFTLLELQ